MPAEEEIREENSKIRRVQLLVDFTCALLRQSQMSFPEMFNLISATRKKVLEYFPGKGPVFDLIYKPRFERIIKERLQSN